MRVAPGSALHASDQRTYPHGTIITTRGKQLAVWRELRREHFRRVVAVDGVKPKTKSFPHPQPVECLYTSHAHTHSRRHCSVERAIHCYPWYTL